MRIGLVTHCFPHTDSDVNGNWIPQFCALLEERGCSLSVLTPRMDVETGTVPKSDWPFEVRYFTWRGGERRLGQLQLHHPADILALLSLLRRGYRELVTMIEQRSIDFCLGIWTIPNGYFCYQAKRKCGVPYGVWSLGSDVNVYGQMAVFRRTVTRVLTGADHLFANSRQLIDSVAAISGSVPLFMPTNRILPTVEPCALTLPGETTHFLYVGRLERVKGIDILIEAVTGVLQRRRDASLHILGDGSLRSMLEERLSRTGLVGAVNFVGWADPDTVARYLWACDAVVIPSRSEGMPVVYWEAMQAGKPVIVTDVGDMAEYTRRFRVGTVVPVEDQGALRQALEDFMDDRIPIEPEHIRQLARESSLEQAVETFVNTVHC